jgi:hypothetical protein
MVLLFLVLLLLILFRMLLFTLIFLLCEGRENAFARAESP